MRRIVITTFDILGYRHGWDDRELWYNLQSTVLKRNVRREDRDHDLRGLLILDEAHLNKGGKGGGIAEMEGDSGTLWWDTKRFSLTPQVLYSGARARLSGPKVGPEIKRGLPNLAPSL